MNNNVCRMSTTITWIGSTATDIDQLQIGHNDWLGIYCRQNDGGDDDDDNAINNHSFDQLNFLLSYVQMTDRLTQTALLFVSSKYSVSTLRPYK
jgi:hypothetical protein